MGKNSSQKYPTVPTVLTVGSRCCIGQDTGAGDIAVVRVSPKEHRIVFLDDDSIIWNTRMTGTIKELVYRDGFVRTINPVPVSEDVSFEFNLEIKRAIASSRKSKLLSDKVDSVNVLHYRVVLDFDGSEQIIPSALIKSV